ncbi:MAG: hypothetical protein KJO85_11575 [Gammaproteobacteria bacterium]|nr:hypothetical protein [Gammaproteobacteria bacterium]NNE06203.1 hypothetical protein [Xanthomonadales bacterium]
MKPTIQLLTFIALAGGFSFATLAQESSPPAPPPPFCENNPGFNDFDFWVGEWNVYSNDENRIFAGTNSITKHYNNCLIKEQWEGANGGGFSINFYNPVRGQWRQVWVANGYSIDYAGGLNDEGAMVMKGEIDGYQTNTKTKFRGKWTAEDNGDVIQRFETYDAANDAWNLWFEGRYVRKETDPNPPASN